MSLNVKVLSFNIIILFAAITAALCDCIIDVTSDAARRPTFYKYVGSHKLEINNSVEKTLVLHEGQQIEARCHTSFDSPEMFKERNVLQLSCKQGYLYLSSYKEVNSNYYGRSNFLCSILKWQLYESSANFAWCPYNVTSYFLVRAQYSGSYNYLASICYDIYNLSFRSLFYELGQNKSENKGPNLFGDFYNPRTEIKYIRETFGSNSISGSVFADTQFANWIINLNYNFASIIQPKSLQNAFNDDFSALLEFLWWPNLRLNNWQHYSNALEDHIEKDNKSYDILAGVSGAVRAPIIKSCQKNYTLEEIVFDTTRKIPLYVWNYLQEKDNRSNEMVVIGFNSPFNEFYSQEDIIFCKDRCHEVSWLHEISSFFHYNIMGLVICCNVEDVRSSKRLEGFPEEDINSRQVATSVLPNDYENEMTDINYGATETFETDDDNIW